MNKLLALIAGIVAGVTCGIAGAFVFADRVLVAEHYLPYGLLLAPATVVLVQLWLGRAYQTRMAPLGVGLGWLGATLIFGRGTSGGDVALPSGTHATIYVFTTAVFVAAAVSMPPLRQLRAKRFDVATDE